MKNEELEKQIQDAANKNLEYFSDQDQNYSKKVILEAFKDGAEWALNLTPKQDGQGDATQLLNEIDLIVDHQEFGPGTNEYKVWKLINDYRATFRKESEGNG